HIKSALQTLLGTPVVQKMLDRKLMARRRMQCMQRCALGNGGTQKPSKDMLRPCDVVVTRLHEVALETVPQFYGPARRELTCIAFALFEGRAGGKISQKNVIFHPMDSGALCPRQNFEHAFTHDLVFSDLANTAEANRSPGVKIILLGVWRQCRQIPGTWLDKAAKLAPALTVKHERWQHVATHGETRGWQRHFPKRKQ
ncbi:unnamed protein product, partial [Symbiodinium necroappetens]